MATETVPACADPASRGPDDLRRPAGPPLFARLLPARRFVAPSLVAALIIALALPGPAAAGNADGAPATNRATSAGVTIERVDVGLNGMLKVGRWARARATVRSDVERRVRLVVEAIDPDGHPVRHESAETVIRPGVGVVEGLFQLGRVDRRNAAANVLTLELIEGNESLARVRVEATDPGSAPETADSKTASGSPKATFHAPLLQSSRLVGVLTGVVPTSGIPTTSASGAAGEQSAAAGSRSGGTKPPASLTSWAAPPVTSIALSEADLSRDDQAFDSLDVLLVPGLPAISAEASRSVERWVRDGGQLALCVGSEAEQFGASVWNWAPIPVAGSSRLRELSGLERFVGKGARVPLAGSVRAAKLGPFGGDVRITGLDGPLLVRTPFGFGQVTFLGLDIDRPPLSRWEPLPEFLRKLVGATAAAGSAAAQSPGGQIATTGLSDLATQVRAAQEDFPEVGRWSTWTVMGLLLAYLLLVGPLDYLLVHRGWKRPQTTWLTFPLIVALCTGFAVVSARRVNGDRPRVSQIDLVDLDVASAALRGRSGISFYSPETRRHDVRFAPATGGWTGAEPGASQPSASDSTRVETSLVWDGVPEESYGGMHRGGGAGLARPGYHVDVDGAEIPDLPVPQWATRALVARWRHAAPGLARSQLTSPVVGQLAGTLSHRFPGPITDWVLAYGNRVYLPRAGRDGRTAAIAPRVPWSPQRIDLYQRELGGYLTGTIATRVRSRKPGQEDDVVVGLTPWNPSHRDPVDILRMATFHDKAEGRGYTGLSNDGLRREELSHLLDLNRAVLFGRIEAAAGSLDVSHGESSPAPVSATRAVTLVRLVLPVTQVGTVHEQLPDYNPSPTRLKPPIAVPDTPAEAEVPESPSRP